MNGTLHITSGDCAGSLLEKSGVPGEVFVWHDILYDGPRKPGWPDDDTFTARAQFLEHETGGGLRPEFVAATLRAQYEKLGNAAACDGLVLWFDACLFDQSMLAHILTCLRYRGISGAALLCVDAFPGIEPFHGLGQLQPAQLASVYDRRLPVTDAQFQYAETVDTAFAVQDVALLEELAGGLDAPLRWVPVAAKRWLEELPDSRTGLGRLESMALAAIRNGCETPAAIFTAVAAAETPPQYWGDSTLWAKINALADREPALVVIDGPASKLPQWEGMGDLTQFRVRPASGRSASETIQ